MCRVIKIFDISFSNKKPPPRYGISRFAFCAGNVKNVLPKRGVPVYLKRVLSKQSYRFRSIQRLEMDNDYAQKNRPFSDQARLLSRRLR